MAPISYSGSLQPKKKAELQQIAAALRLSDQGTKEELQNRIKKHLDNNQGTLEDEPAFAGLFGRRKRSVQPQPPPPSTRFAPPAGPELKPSLGKSSAVAVSRRVTALDPIRESTPVADLHDVSTFLKNPFSPTDDSSSTNHGSPSSQRELGLVTPSSLPPLPPSPSRSILEHISRRPDVDVIVDTLRRKEEIVLQNGNEMFVAFRAFLSNSRNIWSLTAVFELLYILSAIIPWQTVQIPLSPTNKSAPTVSLIYPPYSIFQSPAFWIVLAHWAIPTLFIPAFFGTVISFNPSHSRPWSQNTGHIQQKPSAVPFDPLTASIIRLAAQIAYPFAGLDVNVGVQGLDVLGFRWRVLNAAVGVAFAFAEAIAGAPGVFARTLMQEQGKLNDTEQPPNRRALMGEDTVVGEIE